eukprot:scpid58171/ scgid1006/ Rho GTPase-activating protein 44; NPC-A-10; Rho-type GTPase-activating protein RICH2; RhoGAP interacting with CIP4 homologs protein 2
MKKVNKQLGMLQRAGAEKLGRAEKSVEELPDHISLVQRHHEVTRTSCERVQKKLSSSFQGSGSEYEKRVRKLPQTALANCLHEASAEMGTTPLAQILDLCGDVTQRNAMQSACLELLVEEEIINPLNQYLEHDANALEKLFKKLQKGRLEMDSAASRVHKFEKRPAGTPTPEQEEKRLRFEMEQTESKFHSLQSQYVTDLLEVSSKEHGMASNFVSMMEHQIRFHEECLSRLNQTVPRMREIIDHTPFRPSFGVDLATHCSVNGKNVSMVIENCCAALLPHIEEEEGLFRLAGSVSQVKKLKAHIDYGLLDFSEVSPHTVAGVLKLYLRELPDPLFTEERYEDWKGISLMPDSQHNEKMQLSYQYLHQLPDVNYANIRYLMCFLNKMSQYQEATKMGASNLALVIGPNLFVNNQNADACMHDTGPLCTLVESIITHAEYFFPEGCEVNEVIPSIFSTDTLTTLESSCPSRPRFDTSASGAGVHHMTMATPPVTNGDSFIAEGDEISLESVQVSPSQDQMHVITLSSDTRVQASPRDGLARAQEGFHKASQEGLQKASNSSGRGRVMSSATNAASSAVSSLRSKLMQKDKDKDRERDRGDRGERVEKPERPERRQPPTSPPSRYSPSPATSPPAAQSPSSSSS